MGDGWLVDVGGAGFVGPRWGLPVLARNSACTSIPAHGSLSSPRPLHKSGQSRGGGLTLLEQYPFQQRVLVPEHQALVRRVAVTQLQGLQSVFMMLDRRLQLLDVLGPSLPEGGLRLTVPLLSLFGRRIDLQAEKVNIAGRKTTRVGGR